MILDSIPQDLRTRPQWVCWRYENRDGSRTKVPVTPTGKNASTTDPHTWSSFDAAISASVNFNGIGFVFTGEHTGVDLDHAIDDSGQLKPWAAEIVKDCSTYAEISPSRLGVHLISKGSLPEGWPGRKRNYHDGAVEIYSSARYFTVTGQRIDTAPATIEDLSAFVIELYKKLGGTDGNGNGTRKLQTFTDSIEDRLQVALRDSVFSRLWYGDKSGNNNDDSAADLAFCNKLVFYFGPDPDLIDRLFRQSKLYREKWERAGYRQSTINKAIEGTSDTYTPKQKGSYAESQPEARHEPIDDPAEKNADEIRPVKYSDDALADKFSDRYKQDLRYVPSWGWLEWTGQRWLRITDVAVMDRARPLCREIAEECRTDELISQAKREALARSIASAKTVAAVVGLARGDYRHYSEVHQWDVDLWLFNTPGGTIDLRTGNLREHRRDDRITKIANATPKDDCPTWKAFLKHITDGDQKLEAYLQRLAGYAMVGDPQEECLDFFYGSGGNGKGTYLATIEYLFGEYATVADAETFVESNGGNKHPCDIAKLAGRRLVISNEVDEGQRWDEARIKNLTGRDVMTARFMRQDFFDFMPQFTLIIAGNHKPGLKTVDESIRRRFHLVPFTVTIPAEQQNTNLKNELRAEADGILAWAVAGCLDWQWQRLNPPEAVLAATTEYLQSEDIFEIWLTECCIRGPQHEEQTALLCESFRRWKQERGEQPLGRKTFTTKLTERGFTRDRDMHARKMCGLRLTPEERSAAEAAIEERRSREQKKEWWNRD